MPLVFQMVNAFGRKKAIHESMKSELLTFERIKIAFETQEIHASNDGNMVEIGDTTLPTPQTQNQQRSFYESI
jgi:hypothetical protein